MVFGVSANYILVVNVAFDAESLQNVPKVLLKSLFTVFICQQNACFCLLSLTSLERVLVENASSQISCLCVMIIENVLHVRTWVKVLNDNSLAFHC